MQAVPGLQTRALPHTGLDSLAQPLLRIRFLIS